MTVDWFIFNDNQFTLIPCFTFIPTTGLGLPDTGIVFTMFLWAWLDHSPGSTLAINRQAIPIQLHIPRVISLSN